ncbi:hypothetical protein GUITHDRAFT_111772 [Guillardia theta CCMP2712]|uniref:RRM domain-containing protein n=1 Tax=Guillardia theta (strain CCMP2712) TaxID=905079 RepID=L1J100_GUITC|nr:hypothetical protein GUITHDRAFT_111772 [Guillardia theta CCMP2712]EKX42208.1 hypothetical protein GUITHDRAFT_111772 [Guillardia theta CCMP2712]|eukprot:XP_005829188.1 hypothetical protein GUITHDRAFT_111772 [Guillardia theta CCMP2712]
MNGKVPVRGLIGTNFRMRSPGNAECRVYVGNMDPRLNEGAIVKLFQQFGKLKRCDYLWFTSGPRRGQPRGICFLEFESAEGAEKAIARMNGKELHGRKIIVERAQDHSQNKNEGGVAKGALLGRSGAKTEKRSEVSPNAMIAALKNKLNQMEREND